VAEANLHLTLRFIGTVERAVALGIAQRVEAGGPGGFVLELGELGTFQRRRLASVVWIGVRTGADAARALAQRIEAACTEAGLEPETRRLQPHLTLARARAREGALLPALPAAPLLEAWTATELVLYRSRPGRSGAVHETLATVGLRR